MADTYCISTYGQVAQNRALFAILNKDIFGSGRSFDVQLLAPHRGPSLYDLTTGVAGTTASVSRVSAVVGGTDVTAAAYSKSRTGSTALPAQIKVLRDVGSVTVTSTIRRSVPMAFPIDPDAGSLPAVCAQNYLSGQFRPSQDNQSDLWFDLTGVLQGLTIREGEGFALTLGGERDTNPGLRARDSIGHVTLICSDGTNTHLFSFHTLPEAESRIPFVIFNESGSGVVLSVVHAMFTASFNGASTGNLTDPWRLPLFTFITFRNFTGSQGEQVTILPSRSDAADISAYLDVRRGVVDNYLDVGFCDGKENILLNYPDSVTAVAAVHTFRNVQAITSRQYAHRANAIAGSNAHTLTNQVDQLSLKFNCRKGGTAAFRLHPGEGVAVFVNSNFRASFFKVDATITHNPPNATYPPVGDVDQGVQYGPTGTDYTGTLEQPAVGDVKTGVQYGAGGTEFTGTYVGGGGGNTYSRGRVVNS